MKKTVLAILVLFTVQSQAQDKELIAACAGVQVKFRDDNVDVVHVKVINEVGSSQPQLLVYKNQQQLLKLPVRTKASANSITYRTGNFNAGNGAPSSLRLTLQKKDLVVTGELMEISFMPMIGTTQPSCESLEQ